MRTVAKYARKAAVVQSGLKTQLVFGLVSCAIIAACGVFLAAEGQKAAGASGTSGAVGVQRQVSVVSYGHAVAGAKLGPSVQEDILRLLAKVGGYGVTDSQALGVSLPM